MGMDQVDEEMEGDLEGYEVSTTHSLAEVSSSFFKVKHFIWKVFDIERCEESLL